MNENDPNKVENFNGFTPAKKDKKSGTMNFVTGFVTGVVVLAVVSVGALYPFIKYVVNGKSSSLVDSRKLNNIVDILNENYIGDLDFSTMEEDMYYGFVYGVGDPYTSYYDETAYAKFTEETEGIYAGIGVTVSIDPVDNSILVGTPFEGYPGAKAGILPGDKIVQINGYDVSGAELEEAVRMMKGEAGTSVEISVYRPDTKEILNLEITREIINTPTVSHKMLDNDVAYIRITQFERNTDQQFIDVYNELKPTMKGLILDLRGNPGGLMTAVTKITDQLVPEGTIVYTRDKKGNEEYSKSDANHIEVPLLVLVDGGSASASEVLSGAVKDYGVGELVGTKTFGKGIVQNIYGVGDGSYLKVTMAEYFTPNGNNIHGEGIAPDYEVQMDKSLSVKISQLTEEEDVQLQKAIEIMGKKLEK